jgi:radical SAM superfamily enzyme YgiQ (UPF0313 family)
MSRDKTKKARGPKTRHGKQLPREEGAIVKDWGGRLPIALIYPNSYYLGMSNLGLHALYHLSKSNDKVVGERVFWERQNRDKKSANLSMESRRPLADFPVLAFSISYELDYFNVVATLKANGIPLYAADRDERHPLVIAGGPCITANPMPIAPFFDCLCAGEAEPILPTLLPILTEGINSKRDELLKALALLPGVYAPSVSSDAPVVRQWATNLDDFPVTSVVLTRDTELGDLYLIEVERGCNWSCRFCLVSTAFKPMRFRSVAKLMGQAERGLKYRKRLGLVGPAVSDHPQLEELLGGLHQMGAQFSLSSLRVGNLSDKVLKEIARGGARTITLAPEAGSERLRKVIKKGIDEDDILGAIGKFAEQGIKQLKLYFMIGLPSETDEDIEEIVNLMLKCKSILDKRQSGTRLTLNVTPFVPKAGTPFQRLPMGPIPVLKHRLALLKSSLQPKGIKMKSESPAWSQIQAVLARGDSKVAEVLANTEEVSLSGWRRAVEKSQLDTDFYAHQRWDASQRLPWAIIDSGTKAEYLEGELNKALS